MITLITMIILIIVIIKINIKQTDPGRDVIEVASLEDGTRRRLIAEDQVILIISMMREAWRYQNTKMDEFSEKFQGWCSPVSLAGD